MMNVDNQTFLTQTCPTKEDQTSGTTFSREEARPTKISEGE
jgi:hypothetical protein